MQVRQVLGIPPVRATRVRPSLMASAARYHLPPSEPPHFPPLHTRGARTGASSGWLFAGPAFRHARLPARPGSWSPGRAGSGTVRPDTPGSPAPGFIYAVNKVELALTFAHVASGGLGEFRPEPVTAAPHLLMGALPGPFIWRGLFPELERRSAAQPVLSTLVEELLLALARGSAQSAGPGRCLQGACFRG